MKNISKLCAVVLASFAFQAYAGDKVDKSLVVNGATNVTIDNLRGKVSIVGWDKNIVSVKGELDDEAEGFIFERDGAHIKIKVEMPRHMNGHWNDDGSNLKIKVPESMRIDFSGVSSDVEINNITNSTEAKTVSGNIDVENLSDHVELTSVSGDIEASSLNGRINLSTVSGDISDKKSSGRLRLKAVSGDVRSQSSAEEVSVSTVSGKIDLMLDEVDELTLSTVSGNADGRLSLNDHGRVKMSSVSGDIDLAFENDVQASFRMKSNAGGDLVNRITRDKATHAKYGPSSKLYFETGEANASVKASTVSGQIKVSKR